MSYHVPTAEVLKDIADTEAEIVQMEREIEGHLLIGDRLSRFRADAKRSGIKDRREFIARLENLLKERGKGE